MTHLKQRYGAPKKLLTSHFLHHNALQCAVIELCVRRNAQSTAKRRCISEAKHAGILRNFASISANSQPQSRRLQQRTSHSKHITAVSTKPARHRIGAFGCNCVQSKAANTAKRDLVTVFIDDDSDVYHAQDGVSGDELPRQIQRILCCRDAYSPRQVVSTAAWNQQNRDFHPQKLWKKAMNCAVSAHNSHKIGGGLRITGVPMLNL